MAEGVGGQFGKGGVGEGVGNLLGKEGFTRAEESKMPSMPGKESLGNMGGLLGGGSGDQGKKDGAK